MDLPFRRILNFAYTLITKDFDAEQKAKFNELMEEPEVVAAQAAATAGLEADESVRRSSGAIGFNPDKALAAAFAERQKGLAHLEQLRAEGKPLPGAQRDVSRVPRRPDGTPVPPTTREQVDAARRAAAEGK